MVLFLHRTAVYGYHQVRVNILASIKVLAWFYIYTRGTHLKIAAGCIFYNSEDIILLTIENLIAQGISDFYLIDHGSSDFATDLIFESLDGVANISIFKRESEKFLQGRMMTLLALLAKEDGFDAFVPFDADEFLDTTSPELGLTNEISQLINDNQNFFWLK